MKYRTAHRASHHGVWLPAGMLVEVIALSLTGGAAGPLARSPRYGDGQWIKVTYPGGADGGMVRTVAGLAWLGIRLADLEEVTCTP